MRNANIFIIIINIFLLSCCDLTETNKNKGIWFSVRDVSCTEAWLDVKTENLTLPTEILLLESDTLFTTFNLSKTDTLLYLDELLPNKTYIIQLKSESNKTLSSNISLTTLDTTSHNFTWELYEFGEVGSSTLRDVVIIDENNIWAVGDVYLNDSTGGSGLHNAVIWNGNDWEVIKIPTESQGGYIRNYLLYTIDNVSPTNIWTFSSAGSYSKWNGENWTTKFLGNSISGKELFIENENSIYLCGSNGSLVHFNSGVWQIIETGVGGNLYDIWGSYNIEQNKNEILAVVSDENYSSPFYGEKKILKIENKNVKQLSTEGLVEDFVFTIWFKTNRKYYIGGSNLYEKNELSEPQWREINIDNNYLHSIRGQGLNDIAACGSWGEIIHFNGVSWKSYKEELGTFIGMYLALAFTNNKIAAVGFKERKAVILIGSR